MNVGTVEITVKLTQRDLVLNDFWRCVGSVWPGPLARAVPSLVGNAHARGDVAGRRLLAHFDVDGGGSLSRPEVMAMLSAIGADMPPADFETFWSAADRDSNDQVRTRACGCAQLCGAWLACSVCSSRGA